MFDINNLSDRLREDLINRLFDHEEDQDKCLILLQQWLNEATKEQILDEFLKWNGIIGFTSMILNTIESIDKAEIKQLPPDFWNINKGTISDLKVQSDGA